MENTTFNNSTVQVLNLSPTELLLSNQGTQIIVFVGVLGILVILSLLKTFLYFRVALNASRKLHMEMFSSVLWTSMKFFDTFPSGLYNLIIVILIESVKHVTFWHKTTYFQESY